MSERRGFVAINYIQCTEQYVARFETLFKSRAGHIDHMPGFRHMEVLRPKEEGAEYLVVSHWDSEEDFQTWTKSEAFIEGHRRGFEDIRQAKAAGAPVPMHSKFRTYEVIAE